MKYAIMSDAHSNPAALEAAVEDAKKLGCAHFVFLGDATGYGYDAAATLKLVRDNFDEAILGNHDAVCCGIDRDREAAANPNYDIDREQGRILAADDLEWLRSLGYTCGNEDFLCSHGDFVAPEKWGYIVHPIEAICSFAAGKSELMFCGHTHEARVWELEGTRLGVKFAERLAKPPKQAQTLSFKIAKNVRYIVNAGSVGYPRHDFCSSYSIFDTSSKRVSIRRLPFDFKNYTEKMIGAGIALPRWLKALLLAAF